MSPARNATPRDRLIEPAVLARLANLELVARTAVEGTFTGLHRSPAFGFSQEFAEYRAYVPGDDLRDIDWNVFARTDRTFVKRYYGDTNCQLVLLIDVSGSMGPLPGTGGVSKLDYARFFAAALVHLSHRQHDAAGLLTFDDDVTGFRPPKTRQARRLYHDLDALRAGGASDVAGALAHAAARLRRRSLLVVLSDFYVEPERLARRVRGLAARGHDLLLVHVLDPVEREPSADGTLTLRDMEAGELMDVTGEELAGGYRLRLAAHLAAVERAVRSAGGHYLQADTVDPLDRTIAGYLGFRARHP